MKRLLLSLSLVISLGIGCTPAAPDLGSDFDPVRGKATAPQDDGFARGPYDRRLMTAISYDGLAYTPNETWICDQCHAPDAVVKDGSIFVYYEGWIVGDRVNTSAVAISADRGRTWSYKYLELVGGDSIDRVESPDVVLLDDGTFRLFFTAGNPQGIHSATSADGITFAYEGPIFAQRDDVAVDSTTFKVDDTWHIYARSKDGVGRLWHLVSTDGLAFSVYALTSFPVDDIPAMPANGVWIDDRFHLFLSVPEKGVVSMWSKNGFDWYPSETSPWTDAFAQDQALAEDAAVVSLEDGTYLMVYSTIIP